MGKKDKSFHFDLGNSSPGPVGYCARVIAATSAEALQKLKNAMPDEVEIHKCIDRTEHPDIQYITVYFNPAALRIRDIDDEEDVPDEELKHKKS